MLLERSDGRSVHAAFIDWAERRRFVAVGQSNEEGLKSFAGTVLAVTHDRWFTRSFDRFVVFRDDGEVVESDTPVWD